MSERRAMFLVSDDLLVSLQGKFTVIGVYTADMQVPAAPTIGPQLTFLFIVECDLDDVFESLTLEVTLPGEAPRRQDVPLTKPTPPPGRERWNLKLPFIILSPVLRPGRIEARVIHDKGEIRLFGPWITVPARAEQQSEKES